MPLIGQHSMLLEPYCFGFSTVLITDVKTH